jgi:hypothetical protein
MKTRNVHLITGMVVAASLGPTLIGLMPVVQAAQPVAPYSAAISVLDDEGQITPVWYDRHGHWHQSRPRYVRPPVYGYQPYVQPYRQPYYRGCPIVRMCDPWGRCQFNPAC